MRDNIIEYLVNYGFNKEELRMFQKENEKLYFVNLNNVTNNIEFLSSKGLSQEEILEVVRKNTFMLTCSSKKKELLDNIYNSYFTKEEIKELIIKYPDTYILNPIEISKNIEYLKQHNCNDNIIKEFIKNNINIIDTNSKEFENMIKFS